MKKASKTLHLPPREKHCPASPAAISLQRWCDDIWLKLVIDKDKLHMQTSINKVSFPAGDTEGTLGYDERTEAA